MNALLDPARSAGINWNPYKGYLGQEFIPAREPMTSLREAYAACAV